MYRPRILSCLLVSLICAGCGSVDSTTSQSQAPSSDAAKYFLKDEPAGAQSVAAAKKDAKDGDEITLVGRIGGSDAPFVEGRASFTVVDTSLIPCNERPGDTCDKPWDYCCDTDKLPGSTATVKLVDNDGATLPLDPKNELALKELQTIVVKGKAKRDEAGNLLVLAPAIYVRK